jgi:hypothetical protein
MYGLREISVWLRVHDFDHHIGPRCNHGEAGGTSLSMCLCIHAEENALLEAGRERIGKGAVLYCDTSVIVFLLHFITGTDFLMQLSVFDMHGEDCPGWHF